MVKVVAVAFDAGAGYEVVPFVASKRAEEFALELMTVAFVAGVGDGVLGSFDCGWVELPSFAVEADPITAKATLVPKQSKVITAVTPGSGAVIKKSSVKFKGKEEETARAFSAMASVMIEVRL